MPRAVRMVAPGVPQVVKPAVRQVRLTPQAVPFFGDLARFKCGACRGGEHQLEAGPSLAEGEPVGLLLDAMPDQARDLTGRAARVAVDDRVVVSTSCRVPSSR